MGKRGMGEEMSFNRRGLLGGIGAVAACCSLAGHARTPQRSTAKAIPGTVDVHHHFYPKFLMDAWAAAPLEGDWAAYKTLFMGAPYIGWTPQSALSLLDDNGIATAVLSLPAGTVGFLRGAELVRMVRQVNEYATRLAHDQPGRFGLFALLPMPDIADSLSEVTYALDTLGATGIALMTSYGNRWLGHPDFTPLLEELNRRKAVVHVHPKAPVCCTNLVQSNPWGESSLLEFPYDTGRTLFDLLQSGALLGYPDIQWIFSHLGGVMPMLAGRLREVGPGFWKNLDQVAPQGIDHEFQRLHYDTAASAYEPSMRAALAYLPSASLLFGTDHPHYEVPRTVSNFAQLSMSRAIKQAIQRDNPRRFLSRLPVWHG
jgi:predicted TIM-barrel fold metal-dependent hydrolase